VTDERALVSLEASRSEDFRRTHETSVKIDNKIYAVAGIYVAVLSAIIGNLALGTLDDGMYKQAFFASTIPAISGGIIHLRKSFSPKEYSEGMGVNSFEPLETYERYLKARIMFLNSGVERNCNANSLKSVYLNHSVTLLLAAPLVAFLSTCIAVLFNKIAGKGSTIGISLFAFIVAVVITAIIYHFVLRVKKPNRP